MHCFVICVHAQWLSCVQLLWPWTVAHKAPLSMSPPRQKYWSRLPFPSPRDVPDSGIEKESPSFFRIPYHWATWEALKETKYNTGTISLHFYWDIVELQCGVNYCSTAKWLSHIYTYICVYIYIFFFIFFSIMVCHKILNIVCCAVQLDFVLIQFIYNSMHLLTPTSQSNSFPSPSSLKTIR